MESQRLVSIDEQTSISAVLGYLEAIPGIGSVLGIINAIGHLIFMLLSYLTLESAVRYLDATERSPDNMKRRASFTYTNSVFDAAVDYTVHRNHLRGSLLSIIPFAKPIARLVQGTSYRPPLQIAFV
jgi:hypothetical protein